MIAVGPGPAFWHSHRGNEDLSLLLELCLFHVAGKDFPKDENALGMGKLVGSLSSL